MCPKEGHCKSKQAQLRVKHAVSDYHNAFLDPPQGFNYIFFRIIVSNTTPMMGRWDSPRFLILVFDCHFSDKKLWKNKTRAPEIFCLVTKVLKKTEVLSSLHCTFSVFVHALFVQSSKFLLYSPPKIPTPTLSLFYIILFICTSVKVPSYFPKLINIKH